MDSDKEILNWIDQQEERMAILVKNWASINSFSDNPEGLAAMTKVLAKEFEALGGDLKLVDLKETTPPTFPRKGLSITKRPNAPCKVLLGGHMDTVYPPHSASTPATQQKGQKLYGPGVADMKGGLVVLLVAMEAIERHHVASKLGWEILITPDEEIGSPASKELWHAAARKNHCGLLFEPAFSDGGIASERRGSANWTVRVKGVSAHVGREFHDGRNAIVALSQYIVQANQLNSTTDSTVNVGVISGGGPINVVPDNAVCRINARVNTQASFEYLDKVLHDFAKEGSGNGISIELHLDSYRPPKLLTHKVLSMLELLDTCSKEEGYSLQRHATAGVCDGNTLAEVGLPVLDTLGVVGGNLHTPNEYTEVGSFRLRCRLVTRFLLHIAKDPEGFLNQLGS